MPQRPLPPPPQFGLTDYYGGYLEADPKFPLEPLASDAFPRSRQASVNMMKETPQLSGEYRPIENRILLNAIADLVYKNDRRVSPFDVYDKRRRTTYVPGTLPHETAHAMWDEMLRSKITPILEAANKGTISESDFRKVMLGTHIASWVNLHDKYLTQSNVIPKAEYQYKNDPSHSFADAYAAFAVNPDRLKKQFPEIYDYFVKLTGFEFKRQKERGQK